MCNVVSFIEDLYQRAVAEMIVCFAVEIEYLEAIHLDIKELSNTSRFKVFQVDSYLCFLKN